MSAVRSLENVCPTCFRNICGAICHQCKQNFAVLKSVFSFFKVSILVLSSVDQLFLSFVSPRRPRIERFSSWSSCRSSVLTTRSSVDPMLYPVVEVDLPLRRTNVSQFLPLVWLVVVPGLVVSVGEPLRCCLTWWNVGFVGNDALYGCLWPSSLGLFCPNLWPFRWGSTYSLLGLEIGLTGPVWVEVVFFSSTNCSRDADFLWLRVYFSQSRIGFVGAASVLKKESSRSDCVQKQVAQAISRTVILGCFGTWASPPLALTCRESSSCCQTRPR